MLKASSSMRCRTSCVDRELAHPLGELRDVHRAERAVDRGDRGEEEDRRDERDDDVDDARADARLGRPERDEHVRGDEQDLEADVQVEEVARDERVEDARREDQIRRVEDRDRSVVVAVGRALPDREERTASSTMLEITTRSAASRSTYSTMPNGIGQPPTDTAIACPDESTAYSSTDAIASTASA
jgi:hypothetical protein